jgi:hypothetical protein
MASDWLLTQVCIVEAYMENSQALKKSYGNVHFGTAIIILFYKKDNSRSRNRVLLSIDRMIASDVGRPCTIQEEEYVAIKIRQG